MAQHIKQTTLANKVSCRGVGLHSGKMVNLSLCPAPAGSGMAFRRMDLPGHPVVAADRALHLPPIVRDTPGIAWRLADLEAEAWPFPGETFAGVAEQWVIRRHIEQRKALAAATQTMVSVPGKGSRFSRPKKPKDPYRF